MLRNKVEFQKGMSLAGFLTRYGTEVQCEQALRAWRWRDASSAPAAATRATASSAVGYFGAIAAGGKPR